MGGGGGAGAGRNRQNQRGGPKGDTDHRRPFSDPWPMVGGGPGLCAGGPRGAARGSPKGGSWAASGRATGRRAVLPARLVGPRKGARGRRRAGHRPPAPGGRRSRSVRRWSSRRGSWVPEGGLVGGVGAGHWPPGGPPGAARGSPKGGSWAASGGPPTTGGPFLNHAVARVPIGALSWVAARHREADRVAGPGCPECIPGTRRRGRRYGRGGGGVRGVPLGGPFGRSHAVVAQRTASPASPEAGGTQRDAGRVLKGNLGNAANGALRGAVATAAAHDGQCGGAPPGGWPPMWMPLRGGRDGVAQGAPERPS
jgi:hypothetical protein